MSRSVGSGSTMGIHARYVRWQAEHPGSDVHLTFSWALIRISIKKLTCSCRSNSIRSPSRRFQLVGLPDICMTVFNVNPICALHVQLGQGCGVRTRTANIIPSLNHPGMAQIFWLARTFYVRQRLRQDRHPCALSFAPLRGFDEANLLRSHSDLARVDARHSPVRTAMFGPDRRASS